MAQTTKNDTTQFSDVALNDKLTTIDGKATNLKEILNTFKGKVILLEIWATWCKDCINGIPNVKKLHEKYKNAGVEFVYLSVDKEQAKWKKGIEKYEIEGNHYFIDSGWKSKLNQSLPLDWIPRYMIIDTKGEIKIYRAVVATDKNITKTIDSLLKN